MAGKMDSLKTPDLDHLDEKQSEQLNKHDNRIRSDDDPDNLRAEFSPVSHDGREFQIRPKVKAVDGETMSEQFSTKSVRDAKKRGEGEIDRMDQGVLVNGSYVARKTIIKFLLIMIGIICFVLFFVPPICTCSNEECGCRFEDIFAEKGASKFKTDILSQRYVYNIDAMSSDVSRSYRICTVGIDIKNYLPTPVTVKDFAISNGGEFKDHIVYAYSDKGSFSIDPFEQKKVYVNILINKAGLSDGEFDRAITSLTLTAKGMKKFGFIPCIPAIMHVSDVISFDPDAV